MNICCIEVIGTLVFDSLLETTPERRAADPHDRHLIYEGSGVILDLILKRARNGVSIQIGGQVLPEGSSMDDVSDVTVLIEHGQHRSTTHTNALGEFMFHGVPNGTFDLSIILRNRRFSVRGLEKTEPRMWRVDSSFAVAGD